MNPFDKLKFWLEDEQRRPNARFAWAACLTSIGLDGYPNSRIISLRGIEEEQLIFMGPLDARKGIEIDNNPKVSVTFWWPVEGRQIRIQGTAKRMSSELSDKLFETRGLGNRAQILLSNQGQPMKDVDTFLTALEQKKKEIEEQTIARPQKWGAIGISPYRIEFFKLEKRIQLRELYSKVNGKWSMELLQP